MSTHNDYVQKPLSFFFKPPFNDDKKNNFKRKEIVDLINPVEKEDSPLKKFKLKDSYNSEDNNLDKEKIEPLILSDQPLVQVPSSINNKLRDYQREGVKWLYNLYKQNKGGILADGEY